MLIDILKLPYDKVICDLDYLNTYHPQLWAFPKIHTYSKQQSPFLHVDGDVFIYAPFDNSLLQNGLIAQNEEAATIYYGNILKSLEAELSYFPEEILIERKSQKPVHAFNAGIFGGNDVEFFKTYCSKAFQFVEKNANNFSKINVSDFNIFFEQYLFYCLAKQSNKKVNVLIDKVIGDNMYRGFSDFVEVPYNKHYLHLLGDYKRNSTVCTQMANRLRQDYPEYYYRIIALFKSNKVPLFKDYYWFEFDSSEQNLLRKHDVLKNAYTNNTISIADEEVEARTYSENSVYCRVPLVKDLIKNSKESESLETDSPRLKIFLSDLNSFEDALWDIVVKKFSVIANSYLLARDIVGTSYPEYVFGDSQTIYSKVIVADSLIERIESQFDWTVVELNKTPIQIVELMEMKPSEIYTLVIPECDVQGYSLANIDELDWLILQTIKEQKTIGELFDQMRFAFDADDLESSRVEFEELIFGRIKKGLLNRSIKAIMNLVE